MSRTVSVCPSHREFRAACRARTLTYNLLMFSSASDVSRVFAHAYIHSYIYIEQCMLCVCILYARASKTLEIPKMWCYVLHPEAPAAAASHKGEVEYFVCVCVNCTIVVWVRLGAASFAATMLDIRIVRR